MWLLLCVVAVKPDGERSRSNQQRGEEAVHLHRFTEVSQRLLVKIGLLKFETNFKNRYAIHVIVIAC
jgi:hypothetical protein